MIFNSEIIEQLRLSVKNRLSDKRYAHTLGVEEMARYLGSIILPDKVDELCIAALLHDITKELSYEEQVSLLKSSNVEYTREDLDTKPALHSISALPFIQKEYSEYATLDVLSAVSNHTLGKENMSIFDEIIFISDYSEAGRTYPSCIDVRNHLLRNVKLGKNSKDNITFLHSASLMAINSTIDSLGRRGEQIHSRTYLTKGYLEELILK